jgi:soluble lytic murein transglycosylase-like protein
MRRVLVLTSIASMASAAVGSTGPAALQLIGNLTGLREQPVAIAGGVETSESAQNLMDFRASVIDSRPDPKPKPEPKPEPIEAPEPETDTEPAVATSSGSEPRVQAAPKIAPPPRSYTTAQIKAIIRAAADEFGLSQEYLLSVAECESSFNPRAVSAAGTYHGLFQFDHQTWNAYGYGDIYNPTAQSRTAARLIAAGQEERWPNCA